MRRLSRSARSRRPQLSVEPLEGRDVPAGSLLASISATGVLTITGDDADNGVTLKVTATDVTLTPDATTAVNAAAAGAPVTIPGVVKSVNATLKGGADTVAIDGAAPLTVTGPVVISLGDGDNTLNLMTAGKVQLGALTVKAGDGQDAVTMTGGAGSIVTGAASLSYGTGGSSTTVTDLKFGAGLKVIAGEAGGLPNDVLANNVTVVGPVTASLSNSAAATVTFTNSTLGGLNETGNVIGALLQSTVVNGGVTIKAVYEADLQLDTATVTGSVALIGALPQLDVSGGGTTISGNLALTGTGFTGTSIHSDTLTEVKGAVTVVGGWFDDQFTATSNFKADKAVSLNLKGGDNSVTIGDDLAAVSLGSLIVKAGAGVDTLALDRVSVAGPVTIALGAGNDSLTIENASTFTKTFSADMGSGDDAITIAQNTAPTSTGATTFIGMAKILGGAGNDTLSLGLDKVSHGGDDNSKATFTTGLLNVIDGGLGFDVFDAAAGQFGGVTPIWT